VSKKIIHRYMLVNCFFCLVSVLIFLSLTIDGISQNNGLSDDVREFVEYLEKDVPRLMRAYKVPGASFSLIKRGRIVWAKGFGYKNKEKELKTDINTVYQAASNTKTITAVAIMKLYEEGKIDLDAPCRKISYPLASRADRL